MSTLQPAASNWANDLTIVLDETEANREERRIVGLILCGHDPNDIFRRISHRHFSQPGLARLAAYLYFRTEAGLPCDL